MNSFRKALIERAFHLGRISSEYTFKISKPATIKQTQWRQKQVSKPIPSGITELAAQTASRIELHWDLTPEIVTAPEFDDQFPTSGMFEFNFFETDLSLLEGWKHSFTHWQEYRKEPNPFEFDELFPIFGLINGDLIVEVIGERERHAIYYLDHENGSGDWQRLASSYMTFIQTLSNLWFPNLEWHDSLELFYDHDQKQLSVNTPFSSRWIDLIYSYQLSS
ncbi:hypothetical protein FEM03_20335 [Phragmitibacter flavus]|uniref:SMI1/KNR4 family protein n=1 Tax=Phragmitibacter flavus TaxID=2576071 RepID=A0A5R8K9M6_9BACT|nr:hypothetical protein [Phragmitibacter flavus]TLD69010.1 hypothetical protein FEM03_20335 [Phragmitibacter flavus]